MARRGAVRRNQITYLFLSISGAQWASGIVAGRGCDEWKRSRIAAAANPFERNKPYLPSSGRGSGTVSLDRRFFALALLPSSDSQKVDRAFVPVFFVVLAHWFFAPSRSQLGGRA